jgi:4'-phosphopantetheinyl transferase
MSLPALWVTQIPPQDDPAWEKLLSAPERARYATIRAPLRKRQFLASRALLHRALALETGLPAGQIEISASYGEAPRLINPPLPISLSLSHSGLACACLLAETPCGVDIEDLSRLRDVDALAKMAFSAEELAQYKKSPGIEHFFRLWTAKEARYKAATNCAWLGRLSFGPYRLCAALPLTGLKNLVVC